jgi:hypothetical protein
MPPNLELSAWEHSTQTRIVSLPPLFFPSSLQSLGREKGGVEKGGREEEGGREGWGEFRSRRWPRHPSVYDAEPLKRCSSTMPHVGALITRHDAEPLTRLPVCWTGQECRQLFWFVDNASRRSPSIQQARFPAKEGLPASRDIWHQAHLRTLHNQVRDLQCQHFPCELLHL